MATEAGVWCMAFYAAVGSIRLNQKWREKKNDGVNKPNSRRVNLFAYWGATNEGLRTLFFVWRVCIRIVHVGSRIRMFFVFVFFFCFGWLFSFQPGAVHWNSNFVRLQLDSRTFRPGSNRGKSAKVALTRTSLFVPIYIWLLFWMWLRKRNITAHLWESIQRIHRAPGVNLSPPLTHNMNDTLFSQFTSTKINGENDDDAFAETEN